MKDFPDSLRKRLEERDLLFNTRSLRILPELVDFSSNDYLGLSRSQELKEAIYSSDFQHKYLGSTGSRLLTGNSIEAEQAEDFLAA